MAYKDKLPLASRDISSTTHACVSAVSLRLEFTIGFIMLLSLLTPPGIGSVTHRAFGPSWPRISSRVSVHNITQWDEGWPALSTPSASLPLPGIVPSAINTFFDTYVMPIVFFFICQVSQTGLRRLPCHAPCVCVCVCVCVGPAVEAH